MARKYSIQDANFACAEELLELPSVSLVASCISGCPATNARSSNINKFHNHSARTNPTQCK
jgi:hypothetical protein